MASVKHKFTSPKPNTADATIVGSTHWNAEHDISGIVTSVGGLAPDANGNVAITGLTGPAGPAGAQGPQGIQGPAGTNGTNGTFSSTTTTGSTGILYDSGSIIAGITNFASKSAISNLELTNSKETVQSFTLTSFPVINLAYGTVIYITVPSTLTSASIITLPAAVAGASYTVILYYDGNPQVTSITFSAPSGDTLYCPNSGIVPTASKLDGKMDVYVFLCPTNDKILGQDGGREFAIV